MGGGTGQIQQYPDKLGLDATQSFIFFLLLFTPYHSVLSYPGPRVKLETLAGYWLSLYPSDEFTKDVFGLRLILTAWNILEIDGQTLLGVGGISSSFQVK